MSVSPADFLDSARALATGPGEISKRNAISRAYYAAYHLACKVFPPVRDDDERSGMHRGYLDQLQNHPPGSAQRVAGVKLATLYQRRIIADYRLADSLSADAVARQMDGVSQVFNLLSDDTIDR